jgi:RNA polymerase sigma-70 factor, ECF subfamily
MEKVSGGFYWIDREVDGFDSPAAGGSMASPATELYVSEATLLERVRQGDCEAFYDLVHPCERGIYLAALAVLNNEADAEEVVQEAILKAFKNLARFRQQAKFSTWLTQITINEALMRVRRDRKHLFESLDEGRDGDNGVYAPREFPDWREIPSSALQRKELRQALLRALTSLPPKLKIVLVLRDIQSLSTAETAASLNITEATVKTRLLRARLQMRDALAPQFDGRWSRVRPKL